MANVPVQESIREVDNDSWLVGNRILLSRTSSLNCTWRDRIGGGYSISDPPVPPPETRPLSDTGDIKLVHDAGDLSAVFSIGNDAFCKVRILKIPHVTREHVTIAWLRQQTWSYTIPDVLYHAEHDGRYYMIMSRVSGETLDSLWAHMDDPTKQHYIERIIDICKEMAVPAERDTISGVDGNMLSELYLCGGESLNCSPDNLRKACSEMGMDCSKLVFYHCDLGPCNIMIDLANASVGIIDWEIAGFVPVEWIMTKFRVSGGMDLSTGDGLEWRRRVMRRMREMGFTDVAEQFTMWFK